MNTANAITEELNSLGSSLAGLPRVMPYSVPVGYFESLPGEILNTTNEADLTPNWSKTHSFSTPDGYFEGLTDNILSAVKAEHIVSVSSKENPYSVPAGYFETLPAQALHAAKKADTAAKKNKRISLGRNSFGQIRWAAAAVLLICISFGGYFTFFNPASNTENMLANVPNNEIQDYLQHTYIVDVSRIVNNEEINNIQVENKDIIQYLNETGWDMTE